MESKQIAPEIKTAEEILKEEYEKIVASSSHVWGKWEEEHESVKMGTDAMRRFADQEKRKDAIAFLNSVTEEGCSNYLKIGDSWFLGEDENDPDPEGPFTSDQLYDHYLLSLTQNKEL